MLHGPAPSTTAKPHSSEQSGRDQAGSPYHARITMISGLPMRIDGTLGKWNDDRGFGFITPKDGGPEVFAHISAFPRDGRRPQVGEVLSFEIGLDKEGKKRAINIARPGAPRSVPP
ncbi:cold-shock protein, partial [Aromatoleum toluvorans]